MVIVPPVVVIVPPAVELPAAPAPQAVIPTFAPFVVAPVLLQSRIAPLQVSFAKPPEMELVLVRAPAPVPETVAVPTTVVVAAPEVVPAPVMVPAPVAAPSVAPYVAPVRPVKPFRN